MVNFLATNILQISFLCSQQTFNIFGWTNLFWEICSYTGFVIFQISRLTWYTRFDPVKESEEVVVSDLQTFEDATVYPKDMENDAYPTKEGTLSNPYAGTETVNGNVHCPVYSDLFCFKPISLTLKVQLSSRGRQSHLIYFQCI